MKKMFKKWEGGAKKHGGLEKAMLAQVHAWTEQAAKQQAEELRAREIAEEAEARRALEAVAKREAEEAEAKQEEL